MTKCRVLAGVLFLVIGLAPRGWSADEKIGVVDTVRVLKEYRKTKLADEQMKEQVAEFNDEGEKMMAEHDKLKKDFESARTEAQNKALSEKARNERKDTAEEKLMALMEYEDKMRETSVTRRKQLEDQRLSVHKRLVGEIREGIGQFAVKEGYTLVLDSSGMTSSGFEAVVYGASRMDLTDAVLTMLNKGLPKLPETKSGEGKSETPAPKGAAKEEGKAKAPAPADVKPTE